MQNFFALAAPLPDGSQPSGQAIIRPHPLRFVLKPTRRAAGDTVLAIVKVPALQQPGFDAGDLLKKLPSLEHEFAPGEERELQRLAAAGMDRIFYKGSERYPAMVFRIYGTAYNVTWEGTGLTR